MPARFPAALLCLWLPAAHALCSSDGAAQPVAVLERFLSADCADCWTDPGAPKADGNTLALDWVLPGRQGDNAPLSAVALREAQERLQALGRKEAPERSTAVTTRRQGHAVPLRVAQGIAFNDYIAGSIELKSPGRQPWRAWLLLVEQLPAGAEGSPVPRNLVRNVFRPDWDKARAAGRLAETRAMQIHEGARVDRLRLVAVVQDGRGRMRAIRQTACSE